MKKYRPKILIITPEVTYLPENSGVLSSYLSAKAGGLADVSAMLIKELFDMGVDVHVLIPDYRKIFQNQVGSLSTLYNEQLKIYMENLCDQRVHLAQDRAFYHRNSIYSFYRSENLKVSLAFQREAINHVIPMVRPDLVHLNDWMTGLIPGYLRKRNVPSLFTIHNIHTATATLAEIEDNGIDAVEFWDCLYFKEYPSSYEEIRNRVDVDFLASGIFASHFVNTVSPTFLKEIVNGYHDFIPWHIRGELTNKYHAGCAVGILNAPDASFDPKIDKAIFKNYTPRNVVSGKRENKLKLQKKNWDYL